MWYNFLFLYHNTVIIIHVWKCTFVCSNDVTFTCIAISFHIYCTQFFFKHVILKFLDGMNKVFELNWIEFDILIGMVLLFKIIHRHGSYNSNLMRGCCSNLLSIGYFNLLASTTFSSFNHRFWINNDDDETQFHAVAWRLWIRNTQTTRV